MAHEAKAHASQKPADMAEATSSGLDHLTVLMHSRVFHIALLSFVRVRVPAAILFGFKFLRPGPQQPVRDWLLGETSPYM